MEKGITGATNHDYRCEAYEVYCTTFWFDSFDDFISSGKYRLVKDKEFYTRRIDLSNLILFRFDIKDYEEEGLRLELHYGDIDDYKGLYHDVIKITKNDFKSVEKFLREKYKELETSFESVALTCYQPLYTDTSDFERIILGANKPFDYGRGISYSFDYNFPYHYQWYKDSNGKMCVIIWFADQYHGCEQWIPRIVDLSREQVKIMDDFLRTRVFSYLKKQWAEVVDD